MMPTGSHRLLRFLVEAERERRQILLPILRLHSSSVSPSIIDIALPIIGHPIPCLVCMSWDQTTCQIWMASMLARDIVNKNSGASASSVDGGLEIEAGGPYPSQRVPPVSREPVLAALATSSSLTNKPAGQLWIDGPQIPRVSEISFEISNLHPQTRIVGPLSRPKKPIQPPRCTTASTGDGDRAVKCHS